MKKKLLLMIALLCTVAQGMRAQEFDVWDGHTTTRPFFEVMDDGYHKVHIRTAADLAYVRSHFKEKPVGSTYEYWNLPLYLEKDLDMGETTWIPLGNDNGSITDFEGTFYGQGHTIRFRIQGETKNYQGLFARLNGEGGGGRVQDLHVDCKINCKDTRLVGGICGENDGGRIVNCKVSGDVYSGWHESGSSYTAKVGGVCGENSGTVEYCCVTADVENHDADVGGIVGYNHGNVAHCTFYGVRISDHKQDNVYIGDGAKKSSDMHGEDLYNDGALNSYLASFGGYDIYRDAVRYPYVVIFRLQGPGGMEVSPKGGHNKTKVKITKKFGTAIQSIEARDIDGFRTGFVGNEKDGYTLALPRRDIEVYVVFSSVSWQGGTGTEADPYCIATSTTWDEFAYDVCCGQDYRGKFVKLTADIAISKMVGVWGDKPFSGTFLGDGHTLTANINNKDGNMGGVAPFRYIRDATIKDLNITGNITSEGQHAAGLVGYAHGNNLIEGCTVSAKIGYWGNYAAGFVGHGLNSTTTFRNCVYSGNCVDEFYFANWFDYKVNHVAGFWGWSDGGVPILENCIENGAYGGAYNVHPLGLKASRGRVTNCYYVQAPAGQTPEACPLDGAIQASTGAPAGDIYRQITVNKKTVYYACTISGIESVYSLEKGNVSISPVMTAPTGKMLILGTDYRATLDGTEVTAFPVSISTPGNHTLIFTGMGDFQGSKEIKTNVKASISLADNSDNSATVAGYHSMMADVTLTGRTLYRDGSWNTICLPFSVTLSGSPLEGAVARPLTSASISGTTLNLTFGEAVTELVAGTPYIIKWASGDPIVSPVFSGVTIDKTDRSYDNGAAGDARVRFMGTYSSQTFDSADKSILFMGGESKLRYPAAGASIGAQRAYFKIGEDGAAYNARITAFNIDLGEGELTTGIVNVEAPTSFIMSQSSSYYSLDGRKLLGKPTQKGVYIFNGKKVEIK